MREGRIFSELALRSRESSKSKKGSSFGGGGVSAELTSGEYVGSLRADCSSVGRGVSLKNEIFRVEIGKIENGAAVSFLGVSGRGTIKKAEGSLRADRSSNRRFSGGSEYSLIIRKMTFFDGE